MVFYQNVNLYLVVAGSLLMPCGRKYICDLEPIFGKYAIRTCQKLRRGERQMTQEEFTKVAKLFKMSEENLLKESEGICIDLRKTKFTIDFDELIVRGIFKDYSAIRIVFGHNYKRIIRNVREGSREISMVELFYLSRLTRVSSDVILSKGAIR